MARQDHESSQDRHGAPELPTVKARQGRAPGIVRWVLLVSFSLAAILLVIVYFAVLG